MAATCSKDQRPPSNTTSLGPTTAAATEMATATRNGLIPLILCGNQWGAPRFHQNCQPKVGASIGSLTYRSMWYAKHGGRSTSNGPEERRFTIGRDDTKTSVKWLTPTLHPTLARRRKRGSVSSKIKGPPIEQKYGLSQTQ